MCTYKTDLMDNLCEKSSEFNEVNLDLRGAFNPDLSKFCSLYNAKKSTSRCV